MDVTIEIWSAGEGWRVWIRDTKHQCHALEGSDFEWVVNIATQLEL